MQDTHQFLWLTALTLRQASKIARDGDTIELDSGDYEGDSAVRTQNELNLGLTELTPLSRGAFQRLAH